MSSLTNKKILLGITGGIAAYKSAEIARGLKKVGAEVRVIMTESSKEFITPLTMQALSGNPVSTDLLDTEAEAAMGHIEISKWADAVLIAPCTANTLARLANGLGDDLLSSVSLAFDGDICIAPAMNQAMWRDQRTQQNIELLISKGNKIFGPDSGEQACGDVGLGRMMSPEEIIALLEQQFKSGILENKKIVITAGPTQEPLDPVRYITNRSSGKMGYAIAQSAIDYGAEVTLISGPVNISPPESLHLVKVKTAREMHKAALHHVKDADVFIGTAAVADYRPKEIKGNKIKKGNHDEVVITMKENEDILGSISEINPKPYIVGFAAETENLKANAQKKLITKKLDLIVANDVSNQEIGFDSDNNEVTILFKEGELPLSKASKGKISRELLKFIATKLN